MNRFAVCFVSAVLSLASVVSAQVPRDYSEDDKIIREKVAKSDALFTKDAIIWTGGYLRPFRLSEDREQLRDPSTKNRSNVKMKTTVEHLGFSEAGDMAYEYSISHVSYD